MVDGGGMGVQPDRRTRRADGRRLVALREQKGWSQEELIQATERVCRGQTISKQTLSRMENGGRAFLSSFRGVARALGLGEQEVHQLYLNAAAEPPPQSVQPAQAPNGDLVALRRKENALELARQWPAATGRHRAAVERALSGWVVYDRVTPGETLSAEQATAIYRGRPGRGEAGAEYRLRRHLFELLNFLEVVASAYRHGVADRAILEEQFRDAMIRWFLFLEPFIRVVWENFEGLHLQPWEPYVDLVDGFWGLAPHAFRPTRDLLSAGELPLS
jgi:transcriptional regulator with XRE-family HTH domain